MSEDEKRAASQERAQDGISSLRQGFKIAKTVLAVMLLTGGALYYRDSYVPARMFQAADISFEKGDYGEALETYHRALELKPRQTGTHFRIGYSLEKQGDYRGAMDEYAAHLKDEPDDGEALFRLGSLYFDHDMRQDALNVLKRAKELGAPASADYMIGVSLEALGDTKAAREGFVEAIRRSEGDAELLYVSSKALMRLGSYLEALDGFAEMGKFVVSGDTRAFHASNAAKAMLGRPTDPSCVIEPGAAFGSVTLGATSRDLIADSNWGPPKEQVSDGEHSVWGYGGGIEAPETLIYMENDAVIEIVSSAKDFKTPDGLGVANFKEPKYAGRFDRWVAQMGEAVTLYRYVLKGGGLAFFAVGDLSSAVVYSGDMPLSRSDGGEWVKME